MSFHPTYLQVFLSISLPIMGLAYAIVGGLKLPLVERLGLDEEKVGRLVGGFGTMFGPTILLCGFLTDALGRKGVWLAGSGAVALAVLVFSRTRTFRGALFAVLLLGVGWAAQVNVGNVLMRVAVPPDQSREEEIDRRLASIDRGSVPDPARGLRLELEQERAKAVEEERRKLVWATNFFDFVFGFGAFITPMLIGLTLRKLGYEKGLFVLTLFVALPVVLGFFAEMNPAASAPPPAPAAGGSPPGPSGISVLLSSPVFWVLGFAFLFYVPLETSVAGWATTLVVKQTPQEVSGEDSRRTASLALSGYWLGFTGSRLIVSILGSFGLLTRILGKSNEQRLLLVMAVACVMLMLAVVFLRGRTPTILAILLSGLACGPVFPTMMAVVLLSVPPETMGRAVGIFFFFASVGWTVIPALIGRVARRTGDIQRGFVVAVASGAIFLVLIVVRGIMQH